MYKELLQQAQDHLQETYKALPQGVKNNRVGCLEVNFIYNGVNVSLYYDNYGKIETMILKLSFQNQIYMGVIHLGKYIKDLIKEPELCYQFLQGNNLQPFYMALANRILNYRLMQNTYQDHNFQEGLRYYRNNRNGQQAKPFIKTLKRAHMQDSTYESLIQDNKIPAQIVDSIKAAGYTVVRTDDPSERKELLVLLQEHNI